MRTIKFRAQKKTNGVWVYGSLVYSNEIDAAIYFKTGNGSVKAMEWVYIIPETIGQFTGLFDKNGKEIYEGDIVRHPYIDPIFRDLVKAGDGVTSEVVFHDGAFAIKYDVDDFIYLDGFTRHGHIEVIGNIHDNPSLLKGGKK